MAKMSPSDYKTTRIRKGLHDEMRDYCYSVTKQTGNRFYLVELLDEMWEVYRKHVGVDAEKLPPLHSKDTQEYNFLRGAQVALRSVPSHKRDTVADMTLRVLGQAQVIVPAKR